MGKQTKLEVYNPCCLQSHPLCISVKFIEGDAKCLSRIVGEEVLQSGDKHIDFEFMFRCFPKGLQSVYCIKVESILTYFHNNA